MSANPHITHSLDGVEFHLAENADLAFIQQYGHVFRVFDDHDSGNISFGVDDGERKRFIKLAGLRTINAGVSPLAAVHSLKQAARIYHDLTHPHLVRCTGTIEHGFSFGLIFDWVDGELLRRIYRDIFARFHALPLAEQLAAFDTVIDVMKHVHNTGYVAVDIYDSSFLYDFDRKRITICDIDVFERAPMVNTMGRMWGSSRFMSPEEYELGATIDEITNVYTLGAVAFLFFGDERNRTRETWQAGEDRFTIARRATSTKREQRFASIADFARSWRG